MTDNKWARLLAYVTGLVNQKLLLQNEYLAAENRILRAHLPARMRLSDPERSTLAEIGKRLGRAALEQVACVAKPDTILAWYRRLIARKFDGSTLRTSPGRPRIAPELEALIVRFARENSGWGVRRWHNESRRSTRAKAFGRMEHEYCWQRLADIAAQFVKRTYPIWFS